VALGVDRFARWINSNVGSDIYIGVPGKPRKEKLFKKGIIWT